MAREKKTIDELVSYIQRYAITHYDDGGWDVIHECWEPEQIREWLQEGNCDTEEEAVSQFKRLVSVWADRQADARNSAF